MGLELPNKASLIWGPWALLLFFAVPGGLFAQAGGGYIGSPRCAVCHADASAGFANNPHAGAAASPADCESCHGPGSSRRGLSAAKLAVFREGQPSVVNDSA
jgi:hypothetical protein